MISLISVGFSNENVFYMKNFPSIFTSKDLHKILTQLEQTNEQYTLTETISTL